MSKVVIVTGASGGIGAETSKIFGGRGWAVVLAARSTGKLAGLAAEIEATGGVALAVPTDVTVPAERARLLDRTVEAYGRVDALINNAGLGLAGTVETVALDDLEYVFQLNVLAPVALMQAVVPMMRRQGGGVIVNVSSLVEELSVPYMGGYAASKSALGTLTDAAAVELARDHIAVVKVMPGLTATGFERNTLASGVGLSLEQLLAQANFMTAVPPERVAASIWDAVQSRKNQRCTSPRDRLLCWMPRVTPGLTRALLTAAARRYVRPSGEPSDATIKRDLRSLGAMAGAAVAGLGAIAAGVWLWLRRLSRRSRA